MPAKLPVRAATVAAASTLILLSPAAGRADATVPTRTDLAPVELQHPSASPTTTARPGGAPGSGVRDEDNLALGVGVLAIAAVVGTGLAMTRRRRDGD